MKPNQTILFFPFLVIIFLYSSINPIKAQEFIHGNIFNKETDEVIPFATIQLKEHKFGVITNSNGDFRLSLNSAFQTDSVIISCIGFYQKTLAFSDFKSNEVNNIYLVPAIYELDEITVEAKKQRIRSEQIIRRAIKNIKNNCSIAPFSYVSYFRDYQKYNGRIYNLNEALIYTEDEGFEQSSLLDRYRLIDYKKNRNFPEMNISAYYDTLQSPDASTNRKTIPHAFIYDITGNELIILVVHDAIRNFNAASFSFVDNLSEDFLANHKCEKPEPVLYNNLMLYKINFSLRKLLNSANYEVRGTIYIKPENYAIHKFEYMCFYNFSRNEKKSLYSISIDYGKNNSTDSLMHLKYISVNNLFETPNPDKNAIFKIKDYYLNPNDPLSRTLTIVFNRTPDIYSACKKRNYMVQYNNRTIGIKDIIPFNETVNIVLKEGINIDSENECLLVVNRVKDLSGNVINQKSTIELYQYRELFVQDYNPILHFTDENLCTAFPNGKNQKIAFFWAKELLDEFPWNNKWIAQIILKFKTLLLFWIENHQNYLKNMTGF